MNNNDKNKKISNNYKDYKYVYTGYEEFIKEHHLDKKEIKEEKEKIIHDHRNVFDFNNPNQHTHDYSFDFSQTPTQEPKPYKDKYGNTYDKKPTTKVFNTSTQSTRPNYTTPVTYNQKANQQTNEKAAKTVRNIFLIIFFVPFILSLLTTIVPLFLFMDESSHEEETTSITEQYLVPIEKLCDAIEDNNYTTVSSYILQQEKDYYSAYNWKKIIFNYDYYGKPNYSESRTCSLKTSIHPNSNELVQIEEEYQNKYYTNQLIEDGYKFTIRVTGNYQNSYNVTTIKVNGQWYLLTIK